MMEKNQDALHSYFSLPGARASRGSFLDPDYDKLVGSQRESPQKFSDL